ncbi:helix-turn-helix transcriptional regulator [Aneurinibacillus migulanus]|uniref:helix-turn-helix transcriptional regulator n=1 Tax=Aneurinibacillus migulanus TaxID=47500 RepID=UPI003B979491
MNLENVKETRKSCGLTQEEVAKHLGMTKCNYSKKENGQLRFSIDEALKLSQLFSTTIEKLFSLSSTK